MAVQVLCDAVAPFPEPVARALSGWDDRHQRWTERVMPGNVRDGEWLLHVHSYLVLDGAQVILVDTGIGDHHGAAGQWLGTGGRLPELLADAGVAPGDITAVALTHVHLDHVGWSTAQGRPRFPNAVYLVQASEWAHARHGATYRELVSPVEEAGQLHLVEGEMRVARDTRLLPTPGHTPGHQSVVTDDMILAGDAAVHPAQAAFPSLPYAYEHDHHAAANTRRDLLELAVRTRLPLSSAHACGALRVASDGSITAHPPGCD